MYNQTRESRDQEELSLETGPSIREELGLMEVSMDTLDIVSEGREPGDSDEDEEDRVIEEMTYCLEDDGGVREDDNIVTVCEMDSESSSSGYCETSEAEELDMEAEVRMGETQTESPAQTEARHLSRHQTIFSQMFALLNSELSS